jgi:hypothetical protein
MKGFHWLKIQVPDYYVTCGGDQDGWEGNERDLVYHGAELGKTAADREYRDTKGTLLFFLRSTQSSPRTVNLLNALLELAGYSSNVRLT